MQQKFFLHTAFEIERNETKELLPKFEKSKL